MAESKTSIEELVRRRLAQFQYAILTAMHDSTAAFRPESDADAVEDVASRFQLWVGNCGALHPRSDPRSLTFRLRDAKDVAARITEILSELGELLENASQSQSTSGIDALLDTNNDENEDDDSDLLSELKAVTTSPEAQRTWMLASIKDAVTRLFKVSRMISNATTTDRYVKAEARQDDKFDEQYDILHVREKFKHGAAEPWLIDRLGKAITRRRHYLRYCRDHRDRIADRPYAIDRILSHRTGDENDHAKLLNELGFGSRRAVTEASGPTNNMTMASTLYLPKMQRIDDGFDDTATVSTLATSIVENIDHDPLRIPDLSRFARPGEYFECPFCVTVQRFNGQYGWKKHVFTDIRPFVCTHEQCGMLMFKDRRVWWDHEMEQHFRRWSCPFCRTVDLRSAEAFCSHVSRSHGEVDDDQMAFIITTCSRPLEAVPARECQLCDWETMLRLKNPGVPLDVALTVPAHKFMRHLAAHQEQLALFALPRIPTEGRGSLDSKNAEGESNVTSLDFDEGQESRLLQAVLRIWRSRRPQQLILPNSEEKGRGSLDLKNAKGGSNVTSLDFNEGQELPLLQAVLRAQRMWRSRIMWRSRRL